MRLAHFRHVRSIPWQDLGSRALDGGMLAFTRNADKYTDSLTGFTCSAKTTNLVPCTMIMAITAMMKNEHDSFLHDAV